MGADLTYAQHARLDRLEAETVAKGKPEPRVVGVEYRDDVSLDLIIRHPDGRRSILLPNGRLSRRKPL